MNTTQETKAELNLFVIKKKTIKHKRTIKIKIFLLISKIVTYLEFLTTKDNF